MSINHLSAKYNISESFLEIITDEKRSELVINDIKSDIGNVHIEVLQFIRNTDYFPQLENQLEIKRQNLAKIDDLKKRFKLNKEIEEIEKEVKQYKIDILMTSSSLIGIEENERIDKVKTFFFKGQIAKALEVISDVNLEKSKARFIDLLETNQKLELVYEKLVENAFEFLTKGQLTVLDLNIKSSDDRFQKSKEYFEKGIISIEKSRKIQKEAKYKLNYSNFLRNHNDLTMVSTLIERGLEINRSLALVDEKIFLPNVALILHSLAIYQSDQNEIEKAEKYFSEALKIRRDLRKINPKIHLPEIATLIDDYATFLIKKNNYDEAKNLYLEALKIRRELVKENPTTNLPFLAVSLNGLAILYRERKEIDVAEKYYLESLDIRNALCQNHPNIYLPAVVEIQNNLGILYCDKNDFERALEVFLEALNVLRKLTRDNPKIYFPKLGEILNNVAILYRNKNELPEAEKFFEEALKIFRNLSNENPKKFIPYLAGTLINLSRFYQNKIEKKELSLQLIDEVIILLFPFKHIPYIQNYINEACKTLNKWDIDYKKYLAEIDFGLS
jgi:tetratricopeptide (TPR) repeat protein